MAYYVTNIEKIGSELIITLDDGKIVKYDCKENIMTSYTNRKVKNFPSAISDRPINMDNTGLRWAINEIRNYRNNLMPNTFKKIEMFINDLDLIDTIYSGHIPDECPKGYIKFLRDNNKKIGYDSLALFKASKKLNKNDLTIYSHLIDVYAKCANWYINLIPNDRNKFNKIFNLSAKEFNWNLKDDFFEWCQTCFSSLVIQSLGNRWFDNLDENRNFKYNTKLIKTLLNNKRGEKIIENELKIKAIEKLSNDVYTIKVPETLKDFTIEGQMQHNCVGHYYHDSIALGENLVYFIRLTKNPEKSYITNRYNISSNRTVESRKINNSINNDTNAKELIKQIDEMIAELLK